MDAEPSDINASKLLLNLPKRGKALSQNECSHAHFVPSPIPLNTVNSSFTMGDFNHLMRQDFCSVLNTLISMSNAGSLDVNWYIIHVSLYTLTYNREPMPTIEQRRNKVEWYYHLCSLPLFIGIIIMTEPIKLNRNRQPNTPTNLRT